jgi:hypothetical protein
MLAINTEQLMSSTSKSITQSTKKGIIAKIDRFTSEESIDFFANMYGANCIRLQSFMPDMIINFVNVKGSKNIAELLTHKSTPDPVRKEILEAITGPNVKKIDPNKKEYLKNTISQSFVDLTKFNFILPIANIINNGLEIRSEKTKLEAMANSKYYAHYFSELNKLKKVSANELLTFLKTCNSPEKVENIIDIATASKGLFSGSAAGSFTAEDMNQISLFFREHRNFFTKTVYDSLKRSVNKKVFDIDTILAQQTTLNSLPLIPKPVNKKNNVDEDKKDERGSSQQSSQYGSAAQQLRDDSRIRIKTQNSNDL